MKNQLLSFCIAMAFALTACQSHNNAEYFEVADSLLWANPDSCIKYLADAPTQLSTNDTYVLELMQQHAFFKINHDLQSDSILLDLAEKFTNKHDYRHAGEAYYVLGAYQVIYKDAYEGTDYLKRAERLFISDKNTPDILLGRTYYLLGVAAEKERIYDVVLDYFYRSEPYLKASDSGIYLANLYHHMSVSFDRHHTDLALSYIDSALMYAKDHNEPEYYKEMEINKYKNILHKDTTLILDNLLYLCDSCHQYEYAVELAKYYLDLNDLDKAEEYLHKLEEGMDYTTWCKEQYYYLFAELLYMDGDKDAAYQTMKRLHEWQSVQIENTAYARTYIISQKYEAAKEQEMRLEETIKKQRAYVWIGVLCIAILLISGIGAAYAYHLRRRLEHNRSILRTKIHERLEVAKQLHQWASKNSFRIPEAINMLSPKQAASDTQNWKNFEDEFNLCYDNMLVRWKESYPELTDSDLQYMALRHMGFSNSDIVFLLGVSKQTIYNRSAQVKQHLQSKDVEEH